MMSQLTARNWRSREDADVPSGIPFFDLTVTDRGILARPESDPVPGGTGRIRGLSAPFKLLILAAACAAWECAAARQRRTGGC